ncbi:MAG: 30S ribosomal protein S5 [Candidatus Marinimicrobia bacterium]|nr:30S ribosomal protein S5 [Candidatus Neomarinimicrobiota bacterium]MDD4960677.1 30S ribosomal protein S5 [Candidatus Neomarinimicrobiota bacterium]MDD5709204.1 30S ribosomal protein S5 [Candidatus Neomarinimicrobiota bacterium]MDX9777927.1 30S ribosomal protein S5 [bacterium]
MRSINPSELELSEGKLIKLNRVAKVVTGGRRFRFNAIVAIGDGKGHVGIGLGKSNQVTDAINKGREDAKKNLIRVPVLNGTIPFEVTAKYGAAKVMLKPASPGTGIIAGGPVRAIMEQVGVKDILAKSLGSANSHNVVKATMAALLKLEDAYTVAKRRGVTLQEVFN